jgi:hypothetical protein
VIRGALLIALLVPVACAGPSRRTEVVRARAANDLPCTAKDSIAVVHLTRDVYRARGCGGEIIYTCGTQLNGQFSCRR